MTFVDGGQVLFSLRSAELERFYAMGDFGSLSIDSDVLRMHTTCSRDNITSSCLIKRKGSLQ